MATAVIADETVSSACPASLVSCMYDLTIPCRGEMPDLVVPRLQWSHNQAACVLSGPSGTSRVPGKARPGRQLHGRGQTPPLRPCKHLRISGAGLVAAAHQTSSSTIRSLVHPGAACIHTMRMCSVRGFNLWLESPAGLWYVLVPGPVP